MKKNIHNIFDNTLSKFFLKTINDESKITQLIIALAILVCCCNVILNYSIGYVLSVYLGLAIILNLFIAGIIYFKYKKSTLGGYMAVLTSVIGTSVALFLEGQLSFNFSYFFAIVFSLPFLVKRDTRFVFNSSMLSLILAVVAIITLLISPKLSHFYEVSDEVIALKLRFNAMSSLVSILLFATLLTYIISKFIFTLINAKRLAEIEKDKRMTALYSLGHELRTQINSINGITQLVSELNETPKSNGKQLKKYATILDGCNDEMLQLVNDVLDVHKIESGKLELLNQTQNLGKLISNVLDKYRPIAARKQLEFIEEVDENLAHTTVRIDSSRFSQVLENLISNAIKYTERGHVKVTVTILNTSDNSVSCSFAITDTGVGIQENHYESIFESFEKIKNEDTGIYGGSGLGLSLSKSILEKMNSKIHLVSSLDKGTTFSFDLALNIAEQTIEPPTTIIKKEFTHEKTVLIAEDNPVSMLYTNTILKKNKLLTLQAVNGKEAIELVKNNILIDIVLLDLEMPELNGFDAIHEIKKLRPELPVIAFTATKPEKDFINQLYCIGFNDYLTKPFKKETLLNILSKY